MPELGQLLVRGIVGVLVMPAVIFFSAKATSTGDARGGFIFALIVCGAAFLTAWGVGIFTRENHSVLRENKKDTKGIIAIFKALSVNDQLMCVAGAYLFYCIAIYITNSLEVYYFTYIMGMPTALFPAFSRKLTRKALFSCCLIMMLAGLGLFAFAGSICH